MSPNNTIDKVKKWYKKFWNYPKAVVIGGFTQKLVEQGPHGARLTPRGLFVSNIIYPVFVGIGTFCIIWLTLAQIKTQTSLIEDQKEQSDKQSKQVNKQLDEQSKQLIAQNNIALKTLENAQFQVTAEQFKNAISNLGSEKQAVVLGGVHALHRLAIEYENDYSEQVFDILCSFIREETRKPEYQERVLAELDTSGETSSLVENKTTASLMVIQTIVNKLFLEEQSKKLYQNYKVNLYGAFLRGVNFEGSEVNWQAADLRKVDLQGAHLSGAILRGADLREAKLHGANFQSVQLDKTILDKAYLQKIDLKWAKCQGVYLRNASLHEADLRFADLQNACLNGAKFQKANFGSAKLQRANFAYADLQEAYFGDANMQDNVGANLQRADFRNANVQEANFIRANLQGADFGKANVQGTNFIHANLLGTHFGYANLQRANFTKTILHWADLRGADLKEADLRGSSLQGACLFHANLRATILEGANFSGVQCSLSHYYSTTVAIKNGTKKNDTNIKTNFSEIILYDDGGNKLDLIEEEKKKWFRKRGVKVDDLSADEAQLLIKNQIDYATH